jgi:general secretion pathway protein H
MSRTCRACDEGGYTLLELLLVIALLSMAAAAAIIWVPDVSDRLAVARAADHLERELMRIAQEAMRSGRVRTVAVTSGSGFNRMNAGPQTIELDSTVSVGWTAAIEAGSAADRGVIAFLGTGEASGGRIELRRGQAVAEIGIDWLTASVQRRR